MFNMKQQKQTDLQTSPSKKTEGFHLFNNKVEKLQSATEKNYVKEEYIQQREDLTTAHGSPLSNTCKKSASTYSNDTASETSEDKEEIQSSPMLVEEPALASITKSFPDWDLATIFNFFKSDKPMAEFEKERLIKMEKKRGRRSALKKSKTETKQNKTKKIAL